MYNVSVGEGMCSDVIVTDDSITCRPPPSEPGTGAESKPRVQVIQGTHDISLSVKLLYKAV